jgi:MFS family permease
MRVMGTVAMKIPVTLSVPDVAAAPNAAVTDTVFEHSFARRCAAFAFVLLAEFFYGWAWNTVDVLRPFLRDSLGLSLTQAGSAYSAQGAGALIGAVVIGQLADRLGRRNMLVVIMVGYGLMLLAGALVASYPQLLLQRFILGLFLGGSFPVVVGIYVGLFHANVRGRLASGINLTFSSSIALLGIALGACSFGLAACLLCYSPDLPISSFQRARASRRRPRASPSASCSHPRFGAAHCCWQA